MASKRGMVVAERRGGGGGRGRGVVREIERELSRVERQLSGYRELLAERQRLLAARAAIEGKPARERHSDKPARITQEDVVSYLMEHPGSLPAQIAEGLGRVPVTNVSAHLYRGKNGPFQRRSDGWYVR